jgi:preprotein translocase subunit SecD
MTEFDDVIRLLKDERPQATELELDEIKQRVRRRAADPSRRSSQSMKSRIAILGLLVSGMLFSTAGAGLAISGGGSAQSGTNAAISQYETPTPTPTPGETDAPSSSPSDSPSASPSGEPTPAISPSNASDKAWVTPELQKEFDDFDCADLETANTNVAPEDKPLITCEINGTLTDALPDYKYILGPVEVSGERITDATNGLVANSQGVSTNQWGVNIVFDAEGAKQFGEVTTRLYGLTGARHQFAIVLDGKVISAPTTNAVITDGKPQITGSFTQETSKVLADQLKFGALPIGFIVQSKDTITATLGTTQLLSGLLAGAIGLLLVVGYSLLQYRTLGLVTVASLVVAFSITYLIVTVLSWREGYRLSLAGVAGLIVAIGITADSFIVYFERIRDELRDGRVLVSAVEAGWKRAFRTIFASDAVNFLAAIVLFLLAVGNVRGFALTLGLTTVVDLLVVTMFTHPIMQLLANTEFFGGGHRFSGLDPKALGAVYRGRAQFRAPAAAVAGRNAAATKEAARRQTIAERKAAELEAAKTGSARTKGKDS